MKKLILMVVAISLAALENAAADGPASSPAESLAGAKPMPMGRSPNA